MRVFSAKALIGDTIQKSNRRLVFEGGEGKTGVLTIYMGKPEIPVGRSNGSRHSVWEASENLGFDFW